VSRSPETTQTQLQRLPIKDDVWLDESDPVHVANTPEVQEPARDRSWHSDDFHWFGYARVGESRCLAVKIDRGTWIREGKEWSYFLMGQVAVKAITDCDLEIQAAADRLLPELFRKLEQTLGGATPDPWTVCVDGARVVRRRT
jgi:hypothetical protein